MEMNKGIIIEDVTNEEFATLITECSDNVENDKKAKVKMFAGKIAEKFNEYKKRAVEILENAEKLDKFLERTEKKLVELGPIGKKLAYVPELLMLTRSYAIREYTEISWGEIVAIVAALIYFVSPIDVFPDIIPGLGLLDDILVVTVVIGWCDQDIHDYMEWRKANKV